MNLYGLIGRSLGHSFSEKFFSEKFRRENIRDCVYQNFEIEDLAERIPLLKRNSLIKGLNVTIPYKTGIISFLDEQSEEVVSINACNCIKITNGKWKGFNTDIIGFEKSFTPHLKSFHEKALILGTGGASKAVEFVLQKLKINYLKVSRRKSDDENTITYEDIAEKGLKDFQIVINTTPLGTFPKIDECPPLPYEQVTNQHYFFDLIYNPPKTLFLSFAEKNGAAIENGAKMLQIQAEESWKIWNS